MTRPQPAGVKGEAVAEWVLEHHGWKIVGRQIGVGGGHVLDFVAVHPTLDTEWLVEIKTWGWEPSGKDTIKKAIADAYDLQQLGESRPLLLVMSHKLSGLLGDMLSRAVRAGAINQVLVIGAEEHYQPGNGEP